MNRQKPPRTPTVLQMEAVECGAASLAIVLAYHGRWVPLEQLRVACGVGRDGSKASNILKAARSFGMSAKGFRKEPQDLQDLPRPSIIHWNFNHFLVFEGFRNGRAWINDPASGRTSYPLDEFSEKFTGVVLALEPGETFATGGPRPHILAPLLGFLHRSRGSVCLIALFSLLLVLPGLLIPGLAKLYVDKILGDRISDWLGPICLLMAAAGLLQAGITWMQSHYLLRLEAKLAAVLSGRVLMRLLALPLSFFNQRYAGELAGRVACADQVAAMLSGQVAVSAFNLLAVLIYGAAMAAFDPEVAAVAFLMPLLNIVLLRLLRVRLSDLNRRVSLELGKLSGVTSSAIIGIETLKVSGGENEAFAHWAGYQARAANAGQSISTINAVTLVAPQLLSAISIVAVLAIGGLHVMNGGLTVGGLVALQTLMFSFTGPFISLINLSDVLLNIQGDMIRISDLLNQPAPLPPSTPLTAGHLAGRLELRNINFGYMKTDPPLITDFCLTLEPGRRVALVGGSGSGKSTIGRMIAGLLTPWSGEILLDGIPIDQFAPASQAAMLAFVDQDVVLFGGTVRDNLTLWDSSIPAATLIEALQDAAIHADIAARPGGLDAPVTERGTNFSGGQRQRLDIARALAGNPAILVLDEATAALDPITELHIDEAIRRRGCACVIIAHRLSTIRDADEIVVLHQGQVIERGSHAGLMARDGAYARLIGAIA